MPEKIRFIARFRCGSGGEMPAASHGGQPAGLPPRRRANRIGDPREPQGTMTILSRRRLVAAALAAPVAAHAQHQHHRGQFERLNQPGRVDLPELATQHAVTDSPAPRAAEQGAWRPRAPLPIPRTEMAWAVAYR